MVCIRVKITQHDGTSKKEAVWKGIHKAKAFVYKIVQAREAFFLITDSEQAELILQDHIRQFWSERGLEVQLPPDLVASRTVLVKGLEWCVAEKSENGIKDVIETEHPDWKLERVVKIPGNEKLMKLICANVRTANEILEKGLVVFNQRFAGRSLERELYLNITPCFKCYKYDHLIKNCKKSEDYKVCSECSRQGHRYNNCKSNTYKCLNCGQAHKTLAFRCPVRKEMVKQKITELKKKKQEKIPETELRNVISKQIQEDLPANYLTVIASAITLANIREQECPGVFQYIIEQMYTANDLPVIKYPVTVVAGYEHYAKKKRGRETSEEEQVMEAGEEEGAVGGTSRRQISESLQNLLNIQTTMPAPTPIHTPASTPRSTPVQSPVRAGKEARSGKAMQPTKKKGKRDDDPGVALITYWGSNVPEKTMAHLARLNYMQKSGMLKYVYQNKMYSSQKVKEFITQKKVDLGNTIMYKVDRDEFDKIITGQYMELQLE